MATFIHSNQGASGPSGATAAAINMDMVCAIDKAKVSSPAIRFYLAGGTILSWFYAEDAKRDFEYDLLVRV